MTRRKLILGFGATLAVPLLARAQQAMPVVGFLNSASSDGYGPMAAAFRQGLAETGYVEGQNVAIEYRWANSRTDSLRSLADDLVRRQVAVIFANGPAVRPAKAATTTIPVVFTTGIDPVEGGLVDQLSRPGGNLTGFSLFSSELGLKRLELMREAVPSKLLAVLVNPTTPASKSTPAISASTAMRWVIGCFFLRHATSCSLRAPLPGSPRKGRHPC